ncbi:trafficking protein particle complex 8 [Chrysochromulina tobinii]|uniref:Trafficking protein particle complex 8 n=1 Tax=Chrysochromulina tobinii TaxID=1460289 RepID=A0A0M0JUS1_9EUKA|nr:trafficking protein particle complex 8 [Chrysochromulina tobinii]|eukprot:KOO30294.1 trafficking protein particle complex 8 [Chrysochromulina sp. CCMP291]
MGRTARTKVHRVNETGDKPEGGKDDAKEPRRQRFYAKIALKGLQMRRHEALVFLRVLLALPGPVFLAFSIQQYFDGIGWRVFVNAIFCACVMLYALSAMSRIPIDALSIVAFSELSFSGIACSDESAFLNAFGASGANASCPAKPHCGYRTYEDLCQAVQYSTMARGLSIDLELIHFFVAISWVVVSLFLLGTGRLRADNGYSHLFSRHMIVGMLLCLVQLMNMIFSCMRLLLIVPRLQSPRQADYFEREDSMEEELPLFCYSSDCIFYHLWGTVCLHALIAIVFNFDFLAKYASQLGQLLADRNPKPNTDEAQQKELLDQAIKKLRSQGWDDDAPSFYFIPAEWVRACGTKSLPRMQTLHKDGHLTKMKIPLASAFREPAFCGGGIMANILFVSHRWEVPAQPDVDGEQLKAIKAYLEAHPEDIKWVWFDYSSMPQGDDRTVMEKAEFQLMLAAIADLYLTANVLILLDGSSASRFWPLMEAWCSMQTVTTDGLRPAKEDERRYTIKCIHTATDKHDGAGLVDKVSTKTSHEMFDHLKKPDVNVTNAKDKEAMLPVIQKTNEHVIEMFRKQREPRPASVQTLAEKIDSWTWVPYGMRE